MNPFKVKWSAVLCFGMGLIFCLPLFSQGEMQLLSQGQKLKVSNKKILVRFKEDISKEEKDKILRLSRILKPVDEGLELPPHQILLAGVEEGFARNRLGRAIRRLNNRPEVHYATPVLELKEDEFLGITEAFFVKLRKETNYQQFLELTQGEGVSISRQYPYDERVYFLKVPDNSAANALEMANEFYKSGLFEYAEPDFLMFIQPLSVYDPHLGDQWALKNTGTNTSTWGGIAGADMNVFPAWNKATGASIKVAVLDVGVDLNHPDLINNLLPGKDCTGLGGDGAANSNEAHGAACAGIIGAVRNNGEGIVGVAYNAKIIPIRIGYGNLTTYPSWIAQGIDWACDDANADVLSNSYKMGSPSALIRDAIDRAATNGRGGKGSVVVFAAGNNGTNTADFPSSYHKTISVIAMSMCNERKSFSSCDGESWSSNYGTNTDVAAPGVDIYTTDNVNSGGYSANDYYSNFGGTSSACPNVAGVVALILSANPSLTGEEARYILESTCEKVGGYTYNPSVSGQPNSTWSDELGYGRVNAYKAVCKALLDPDFTANSTLIPTGSSVTFSDQSGGSPTAWNWVFNGGSPATTSQQNPTVAYSTPGVYDVKLTITGCANTQDTEEKIGYITVANPPVANAGPAKFICPDGNVQIGGTPTASSGTPPYTYSWSPAGSLDNPSVANPAASPATTTTYTVTVTDANGFEDIGQVQVNLYALTADAGPVQILCPGGPGKSIGGAPTASGSSPPFSYSWAPAIGLSANNVANPVATPATTTTYTLTVTDANGCTETSQVQVKVETPAADAGSDINLCLYDMTPIGGNPAVSMGLPPYTYDWTPSTGLSDPTLANPEASPTTTTQYTVVVTDANGCISNASSMTITVSNIYPVADAGPDQGICAGESVTIGGSPTASGGSGMGYSIEWSPTGNMNDPTIENPTVTPANTTTYTVVVKDFNGCKEQDEVEVTVHPVPVVDAGDDKRICIGYNTVLGGAPAITSGTAPFNIQWQPTSGLNNPNSANPTAMPITTTDYSITVVDAYGCQDMDEVKVIVDYAAFGLAIAADGPTLLCPGEEVRLYTTHNAPYDDFRWYKGSSSISGAIANEYMADQTGAYSLKVTNTCGAFVSNSIFANIPPLPTIDLGPSLTVCEGEKVLIEAQISGGVHPYTYLFVGGNTSLLSCNTCSIAFYQAASAPSTKTFQLEVRDMRNCSPATGQVSITSAKPPNNVDDIEYFCDLLSSYKLIKAKKTIYGAYNTCSSASVQAGVHAEFRSAGEIILNPGFITEPGSNVLMHIKSMCGSGN